MITYFRWSELSSIPNPFSLSKMYPSVVRKLRYREWCVKKIIPVGLVPRFGIMKRKIVIIGSMILKANGAFGIGVAMITPGKVDCALFFCRRGRVCALSTRKLGSQNHQQQTDVQVFHKSQKVRPRGDKRCKIKRLSRISFHRP